MGTLAIRRFGLALLLAAAVTTPAAQAGGLNVFKLSKSEELKIGQQMHDEYARTPGLIGQGKLHDQVQRIGRRLVKRNGLKEYQYQFFLVNDKAVNAFTTPGGYIYVHKGLIDLMGYDESMLAGVIAHELGHARDRHPAKAYEKQMQGTVSIGVLGALIGKKNRESQLIDKVVKSAGSLMYLKYNRDQEEWADGAAVNLTHAAGYDAYGMQRGLQCLNALYGSSSELKNYFENHPPTVDRIVRTARLAHETAGRAHGYMTVPIPPGKPHPLWKLYGPGGTERVKLGKPDRAAAAGASTDVVKRTSPAKH